jgi:hypothetical protein
MREKQRIAKYGVRNEHVMEMTKRGMTERHNPSHPVAGKRHQEHENWVHTTIQPRPPTNG